MNNLTEIYTQLEHFREVKSKAILMGKDNLAMFCYRQIRAIKRIKIGNQKILQQNKVL